MVPHTTAYKIRQHLPVQSQTQHRHTQAHVRGRTLSDTATHSHPTNTPGHNYTRSRVTLHPHTATQEHTLLPYSHTRLHNLTHEVAVTQTRNLTQHPGQACGQVAWALGPRPRAEPESTHPQGSQRLSLHVAMRLVFNVNTQSPKAHTFPRGVQGACEP